MPLLGDASICEIPEFSQREIPFQIKVSEHNVRYVSQ
jgi:hypothetical protein